MSTSSTSYESAKGSGTFESSSTGSTSRTTGSTSKSSGSTSKSSGSTSKTSGSSSKTSGSTVTGSSTTSKDYKTSVLHHKCPVVKLVRSQMEDVDANFSLEVENLKKRSNLKKLYIALALLLLLLVFWGILVYGAMIGAEMCGGDGSKEFGQSCKCGSASVGELDENSQEMVIF